MKKIRRIDLNIQAVIGIVTLAGLVAIYLFFAGLAVLGAWQLLSALLNTPSMYRSRFRKYIIQYWILSAVALLLLIPQMEIFTVISIVGSAVIAIYYWIIYKNFIAHLEHRDELSTVIRH